MIGEELSPDLVTEGLVWVVDPLDGTTNFLHGFPSYAVSIAAAVDGVLEAGVVLQVPRNEVLFRVARWRRLAGGAAPDRVDHRGSGVRPDRHRISFRGHRRGWRSISDQFARVAPATSGIRRPGAAALDLADVAAGRFDGSGSSSCLPGTSRRARC